MNRSAKTGRFIKRTRRNPSDAETERLIAHHRRLSQAAEHQARRVVARAGNDPALRASLRPRIDRLLMKAADHGIKIQKLSRLLG